MFIQSTIGKVAILIGITIVIGAIGFKITGGDEWSFVDSIYMAIITISTVGFTEVHTLDTAGRLWAIIVILLGIGIVAFAISKTSDYLVNFNRFRRRKMIKKLKRLKNHFIVCGYGRMGKVICDELFKQNLPFIVVENDPAKVQKIETKGFLVVDGDATLDETLLAVKIKEAKGIVVVLSSDSDNLYVTMSARTLAKDLFITSRCSQYGTIPKLKRAGADKIVNPYTAGGHKMAELLITPEVEDSVEIATPEEAIDLMIEEIRLDATTRYNGIKIRDSRIREDYNLLIAGLIGTNEKVLFNPDPDYVLNQTDTIMLMGQRDDLKRFKESF